MDFRQNAARRRRFIRDESRELDARSAAAGELQPFRRYQATQVLDHQSRTLDFFPTTRWMAATLAASVVLVAGLIIGLSLSPAAGSEEVLGKTQYRDAWELLSARPEWWAPTNPGSIGELWLFGVATFNVFLALQIYALRKHRQDDYQGTYQVWRWAALPLAGMAFASLVMPRTIALAVAEQTISPAAIQAALWGTTLIPAIIALVYSVRFSWELSESWPANISQWIGSTALLLGTVATGSQQIGGWHAYPWIEQWAAGHLWVIAVASYNASLLAYLSHVYRDVMGLLPVTAGPVVTSAESGEGKDDNPNAALQAAADPMEQDTPAVAEPKSSETDQSEEDVELATKRMTRRRRRAA